MFRPGLTCIVHMQYIHNDLTFICVSDVIVDKEAYQCSLGALQANRGDLTMLGNKQGSDIQVVWWSDIGICREQRTLKSSIHCSYEGSFERMLCSEPNYLGIFATPVFLLKWQNHHANHRVCCRTDYLDIHLLGHADIWVDKTNICCSPNNNWFAHAGTICLIN